MNQATVNDVIRAECMIEPIQCVHCESLEVVFNSHIGDGYCQECGEWQLEISQEDNQ